MSRRRATTPTYREHAPTGRAFSDYYDPVTGEKRTVALGRWNTAASRREHAKLCAETASGRTTNAASLTLNELMSAYLKYAREYYRKDGKPTGEIAPLKTAIKAVRVLYGHCDVSEFGPIALSAVRQSLIDGGLARSTINMQVGRVRRIFRWAVARQLVRPEMLTALSALEPLKKGRCRARETAPVRPVADCVIDAVLTHLPAMIADLVRLQRLTGARPAETCAMRADEIERPETGAWVYKPGRHKTQHIVHVEKLIFIGPRAQTIIAKYLADAGDGGYLFKPARSESARAAERREHRTLPLWPSHASEARQARRRSSGAKARAFRPHYSTAAYRRAIERACLAANVERFSPHQIRHTVGTDIRARFGIEAAKTVLGHSQLSATEVYAERDHELARRVVLEVG
jgi:integrase